MHSTNDYAIQLLSKSNPIEGTVISTYNQQQGKGQIGRRWFSDENKNITLSIILRPTFLPVSDYFYLSMIAALAIHDVVSDYCKNETVSIKWPNDIYIYNKKVGGLLLQQTLQARKIQNAIVGIGLNVNQDRFPDDLPNPISIKQINTHHNDLPEVQKKILKYFSQYYRMLQERKFIPIKKAYLEKLYRRGDMSTFYHEEKSFIGEILGIDQSGKLQISVDNTIKSFNMHEIRLKIE